MTPQRYAQLLDKLRAAESDMLRAVRKWDKLRAQVRRADKALDRQVLEREKAGGLADWRGFGDKL